MSSQESVPSTSPTGSRVGDVNDESCGLQELQDDSNARANARPSMPLSLQQFYYEDKDDTREFKRSMANQFVLQDKKMCDVIAMTIGMHAYDNILLQHPFKATTKKIHTDKFTPNAGHLRKELLRRAHFIMEHDWIAYTARGESHPLIVEKSKKTAMLPRPKAWSKDRLLEWLTKFPIQTQQKDLDFLRWKIVAYKEKLTDSLADERTNEDSAVTYWERKGWQNLAFRCRFIDVITSDEMKHYFIKKDSVECTRTEFDARGTEREKVSPWQRMADEFNDESKTYQSAALGEEWGHWYSESKDLSWNELATHGCHPLTDGKEMKKKFAELNNMLGAVYKRFSMSGNGDDMCGTQMESGTCAVDITMLPTQGGDRLDFLNSTHPAVLYLWYQLLAVGLWQTACTEFPTTFSAEDGDCPITLGGDDSSIGSMRSGATKKRDEMLAETVEQGKKLHDTLVDGFNMQRDQGEISTLESCRASLSLQLAAAKSLRGDKKKEQNEMRIQKIREKNKNNKAEIQDIIDEIKADVDTCDEEIALFQKELDEKGAAITRLQQQVLKRASSLESETPRRSNQKGARKRSEGRTSVISARQILFENGSGGEGSRKRGRFDLSDSSSEASDG